METNKTFTLKSDDLGGIASLRHVNPLADGENKSPELHWINAPALTKSFTVTIHDPDAPTGSGYWHWQIIDIPAHVTSLPINAGDPHAELTHMVAKQMKNDAGTYGYTGPCPPVGHGFHMYLITVFALDVIMLNVDHSNSAASIGFMIWSHTIEKASMVMYYKR